MEQKFEKNFLEKFGDFYSKMGNRALFSIGCILVGVVVELILAGTGIGFLIGVFSAYNLISICEKEKTNYTTTVRVTLPNGKTTACALFEQKVYAHAPLIMAFFSIGFYIPYKTQYILVPYKEIKNIPPQTRVPTSFLTKGLLKVDIIPQSKYRAIIRNPQIIANELYEQIAPRREAFLKEVKPFFETDLLEEIYYTEDLSICKVYDNETFILFHYESHSGVQCGFFFNEDYIDKIKEDPSFLLESYIGMENPKMVFLTDEVLERLLRGRKTRGDENVGSSKAEETADRTEKMADSHVEAEKAYMDEVNKNKTVFTRKTIASRLKSGKCTGKKVWGIILLFFALGGFEIAIFGIVTGAIVAIIIGLLVGILLVHFGVKNIKISNANRNALTAGDYKIVKTTCTKRDDEEQTDADGDPCGYSHTHYFSNGDVLKLGRVVAVEGDTVYLVYLHGDPNISTYFNGIEYIPANDLVIEE